MKTQEMARPAAVLTALILSVSAVAVDSNGLIAHWKFDEGSGSTAFDSVGVNHGTLVNGPTWAVGQIDGALNFDGYDDCVSIPDSDVFDFGSGEFSIALWFKTDGPNNPWQEQFMVNFGQNDNDPHIEIYTAADRLGTHLLPHSARITDGYAEDGRWHHAAITLDNGVTKGYKLYLDGVNVGQRTYSGILSNWDTLKIGGDFQGPGMGRPEYFRGSIDEVVVYNRALSREEIERLYRGELLALEISGPNEVAENFQAQYTATAHYDNNSTRDVTDLAHWSVEPNDYADIDSGGLFSTADVDRDRVVAVSAEYTEDATTVSASKEVTIFPVCPTGYALEFDGADDYVEINVAPGLDGMYALTSMGWIKTTNSSKSMFITNKYVHGGGALDEAYALGVTEDGRIKFQYGVGSSYVIKVGTPIVADGDWHHIVGVYTGSDGSIYIDGAEASLSRDDPDPGGRVNNISEPVLIGCGQDIGLAAFFDGTIDEVAIYKRALSAQEIRTLMHSRPGPGDPNLVGHWNFDEGEGQVAYDSSIYGNDGTLGSTPQVDDSDPAWVESDAPVGICTYVALDIKPGGCPNPLNVASKGILPAAILGSEELDVNTIDPASIFLQAVPATRSGYEDVAGPVIDGNECECTTEGPDGYTDMTLKFKTEDVVGELLRTEPELVQGQQLKLTLSGQLFDGRSITGADCVVLVGNVPRHLVVRGSDINEDGVINMLDLARLAEYWLESYQVE